jgi:hypothetical protein
MNVAVIGSGFAGTFAAKALVDRGFKVTILDVGDILDSQRDQAVRKLRSGKVDLSSSEFKMISENSTFDTNKIPTKLHFGSDYIYAKERPYSRLDLPQGARGPYPTFAKGGFSNIWGAAVLPTASCDTLDWPIPRPDIEKYFKKVADFIPLCGGTGNLDEAFPIYHSHVGVLDHGSQAQVLMRDLAKSESQLRKLNTLYGTARLSIYSGQESLDALSCNGCGNCFSGCFRGSIFSTASMQQKLSREYGVTIRNGMIVTSVNEKESFVEINIIEEKSGVAFSEKFDSIFIGAGPLNSARILLRSQNLYNHPIYFKQSQKFAIPAVRLFGAPTTIDHPSITLGSVFIETKVPQFSDHWLHVQMVSMNDTILRGLGLPFPKVAIWRPFLERLMIGWCGMHSDYSSIIQAQLLKSNGLQEEVLKLTFDNSEIARDALIHSANHLWNIGKTFQSMFLSGLRKVSNPGSGTHCGSSFPMVATPTKKFDSDTLGRPFGYRRIYVVDSSVLPSIPGTTLAMPVMANAYRIGSEAQIY